MGLQKQFNAGCLGSMFICGGLVSAALAHISSMWASATAATREACAFVQKQSRTNAGTKVPTRSDKSLKRLIAPIRPPTIGGAAARYLQVVCSPGVNRTFKHALLSLETHESHSQPRLGAQKQLLHAASGTKIWFGPICRQSIESGASCVGGCCEKIRFESNSVRSINPKMCDSKCKKLQAYYRLTWWVYTRLSV